MLQPATSCQTERFSPTPFAALCCVQQQVLLSAFVAQLLNKLRCLVLPLHCSRGRAAVHAETLTLGHAVSQQGCWAWERMLVYRYSTSAAAMMA